MDYPTGTVPFLFTDVEGSTRRWEQQPEAIAQAFARQEVLLREVLTAYHGYAYKMIGDAFQVAFRPRCPGRHPGSPACPHCGRLGRGRSGTHPHLDRLEVEHNNLRAALRWARGREPGDHGSIARALSGLGHVAAAEGDYTRARALQAESVALMRELGDRLDLDPTLGHLGFATLAQGNYMMAAAYFAESPALARESGARG